MWSQFPFKSWSSTKIPQWNNNCGWTVSAMAFFSLTKRKIGPITEFSSLTPLFVSYNGRFVATAVITIVETSILCIYNRTTSCLTSLCHPSWHVQAWLVTGQMHVVFGKFESLLSCWKLSEVFFLSFLSHVYSSIVISLLLSCVGVWAMRTVLPQCGVFSQPKSISTLPPLSLCQSSPLLNNSPPHHPSIISSYSSTSSLPLLSLCQSYHPIFSFP